MDAIEWAALVRHMLDRESVIYADTLGVDLTPLQIASLRSQIILDWVKRKLNEDLHYSPTMGDLADAKPESE